MKKIIGLVLALLTVGLLAGCSTAPEAAVQGDTQIASAKDQLVQQQQATARYQNSYDGEVRDKEESVQSAIEWTGDPATWTFGIPPSGWVAIMIFSSIIAALVLVVIIAAICWRVSIRNDNRNRLAAREHEKEIKKIERGACGVCGFAPTIDADIRKSSGSKKGSKK